MLVTEKSYTDHKIAWYGIEEMHMGYLGKNCGYAQVSLKHSNHLDHFLDCDLSKVLSKFADTSPKNCVVRVEKRNDHALSSNTAPPPPALTIPEDMQSQLNLLASIVVRFSPFWTGEPPALPAHQPRQLLNSLKRTKQCKPLSKHQWKRSSRRKICSKGRWRQ